LGSKPKTNERLQKLHKDAMDNFVTRKIILEHSSVDMRDEHSRKLEVARRRLRKYTHMIEEGGVE
jgi:hypothetical protein